MYSYNPFFYMCPPFLPPDDTRPPTVYSILESIVNYGKEEQKKIADLAKYGRSEIFDFDYPLSTNVSKEKFETIILNHYIMRRIGFETVTAFKIQLDVKLNEIMPKYNKMIDSITNWDLFRDGQIISHESTFNETGENANSNSLSNTAENATTTKRKESDLPQGQLTNLDDNKYVTKYEKNETTSNDTSGSTGTASGSFSNDKTENSVTRYSQADLVKLYVDFQNELKNIYSLIFKDLDILFYELI